MWMNPKCKSTRIYFFLTEIKHFPVIFWKAPNSLDLGTSRCILNLQHRALCSKEESFGTASSSLTASPSPSSSCRTGALLTGSHWGQCRHRISHSCSMEMHFITLKHSYINRGLLIWGRLQTYQTRISEVSGRDDPIWWSLGRLGDPPSSIEILLGFLFRLFHGPVWSQTFLWTQLCAKRP